MRPGVGMVLSLSALAAPRGILKHDPEKWLPVSRLREARFGGRRKVGKRSCSNKKLERDDDSTKSHPAPAPVRRGTGIGEIPMPEAFIYDHVRTPRGRGKIDGALHEVTALNLVSQALGA